MLINYDGQSVLVTGAASGIGAALARALVARGAHVICADVDEDGLNQTLAIDTYLRLETSFCLFFRHVTRPSKEETFFIQLRNP